MPIQFTCTKCGATLRVKDESAGKAAKCSCGEIVRIPATSTSPATGGSSPSTATAPTLQASKPVAATSGAGTGSKPASPPPVRTKPSTKTSLPLDQLTENDWARSGKSSVLNPYAVSAEAHSDGQFLKTYISKEKSLQTEEPSKYPKGLVFLAVVHFIIGAMYMAGSVVLVLAASVLLPVLKEASPLVAMGIGGIIAVLVLLLAYHTFIGIGYLNKMWFAWCMGVGLYTFNMIDRFADLFMRFRLGTIEINHYIFGALGTLFSISLLSLMKQKPMLRHFRLTKKGDLPFWISVGVGLGLGLIVSGIMIAVIGTADSMAPPPQP